MKKDGSLQRNYILLPVAGVNMSKEESPKVAKFLDELNELARAKSVIKLSANSIATQSGNEIEIKVLDSINENGAKLIKMNNEHLASFRFSYPGLRVLPERFFALEVYRRKKIEIKIKQSQVTDIIAIRITDQHGESLEGVTAVAFTDFSISKGSSGLSDEDGIIKLRLNTTKVERLYVYADHSYWGIYRKNITISNMFTLKLKSIDTDYKDCLRYFYNTAKWPVIKQKVRVGVIDTGIGPHRDLKVTGGKNLVTDESDEDWFDNGEGHGTHVGGIIAASGKINGLAAGVEIMSYRVFRKGGSASNFDIMKAINQAIKDDCHLINMSLGEVNIDEGLISYINEAYNKGILCFSANGNDNRSTVSFPAAHSLTIAVSAMGRKGTFPAKSVQTGNIRSPFGTDPKDFIADFSNVGPETDLTAPGVGIISTYPDNLYAVMDGTSMSCPAATGVAARLLSSRPDLLELPQNQIRADEMTRYIAEHIKPMGFGANFEGKGMLFV